MILCLRLQFDCFLSEKDEKKVVQREFNQTPTWAVAGVCTFFIVVSVVLEKLIHKVGTTWGDLESFLGSGGSSASKQFGEAYDALSLNNLDKLRSGMQQAIKVQRAILRQGSAAITKTGCIRSGRKFRWVKVEDSIDAKYLGYPQALTKFCYFLMDALREKGARMKPMLCACTSQQQGKILVVGVCGKPRLGAVRGKAFGNAFRKAAQESRADYFHELFESSWIVLDASAVNSFMIRLTEKL